jgi:hypothetical protein
MSLTNEFKAIEEEVTAQWQLLNRVKARTGMLKEQ